MKDRTVTISQQILCLGLLALSIASALWQSGDPALTLLALALVFPVGFLSRLPERWFPMWLRQGVQALIGIGAICWCQMRVTQTTPDVALVETATLLAFGLSLSGIEREYGLMVLISLILVGFGGTSPGRSVYLFSVMAYVPVGMLFLYQTRVLRLTGPESSAARGTKAGGSWGYRSLHFSLFAAITVLLIQTLPQPHGRSAGVVPVAFSTTQQQEFPMLWRDWVGTTRKYITSDKGTKTVDKGKNPSVVSKKAKSIVDIPGEKDMDSREGPGSGGVGDDLVMRVKSPARLYWLAQLYDLYDGNKWKASTPLRQALGPEDQICVLNTQQVQQHFSIEKAVSRRLYSAFRAETFRWRASPSYGTDAKSGLGLGNHPIWGFRGFGATLTRNIPALPWQYVCSSRVPAASQPEDAAAAIRQDLARVEAVTVSARKADQRQREQHVQITSNWDFVNQHGAKAKKRPGRALRLRPAGENGKNQPGGAGEDKLVPEAVPLVEPASAFKVMNYQARSGRRMTLREKKKRPWHGALKKLGISTLASRRQREFAEGAALQTDELWGSADSPSPYRSLKKGLISERVHQLAEEIAGDKETPLAKAEAIRDYLRSNYTYEITAPRIPPEAEVVDYFLFESKIGYCQHFAQAFVVLARCAGLPSRLATGYSPGKYNLLTGTFEVYEYHAHAWTQVFCEPFGWLTFDGAPPGNLRIESTPGFLAKMLDPFGDEWESRPPELALLKPEKVASPAKKEVLEARKKPGKASQAVQAVWRKAALDAKTVDPSPKDMAKAALKLGKQWLLGAWQQAKGDFFGFLRRLRRMIWRAVTDFFEGFIHMGAKSAILPLTFLVGIWALLRYQEGLLARYRRWCLKRRCVRLWRALLRTPRSEATTVVSTAHQLVQELMALAEHPRPGNVDTLEYAEWTATDHPIVAADLKVIAVVFARLVFSCANVTIADAASVLESTRRIRVHFLLAPAESKV